MNDRRSLIWSSVVSCLLVTAGCAQVQPHQAGTISDLTYYGLKAPSNEPLIVTNEDVVARYRAYIEVADHHQYAMLASRRIAALRLNEQEAAWTGDSFTSDEEEAVDPEVLAASIRDFEALLADHPDNASNDEILYQLAKAYNIAAEPEETARVLEQLVERHPDSLYYLDAEFRLGELRYAMSDYVAAEQSFQRLVKHGRIGNKYYSNAGYMLGWSLFKQSRYDDSLLAFARLIDEDYPTQSAIDNASGANLEILKDSVYTMAVAFSYRGEWEEIGEFFDLYGRRHYEYLIYDRLADFYYEQKYYQSGASTLAAYVERYPDSDRAPVYYQRMVDQYAAAGYPVLQRQSEADYIDRFGIDSEYWANHGEEVHATIREPLAGYIMDLAKFNHGWAQQTKDSAEKAARYAEAAKWYDIYLRSVPDAADAAEAHFLLAEIAYELGNYKQARDHYEIVAYQYPDHPRASEAAYATVLAYSKYKPTNEDEAAEWRQQSAENSMRFINTFPEHEERGKVLVSTSELFLADKNHEEALSVSRMAWGIQDNLSDKHRYGAALVRGHSAFELGYYTEAEEAFQQALKYNKIDGKTRKDIREKLAASIYKQGEQAREAGDYELAAASWNRIGDVTPGSENSIIAEYDAATMLFEVEDYAGAEKALKAFQRKYPKHKLSQDIPTKLIFTYEKQEKWATAANALADVWRTSKDKKEQRIACFQSGEYYEKAGDIGSAIVMFKRYANNYSEPFDPAIEAHYKLEQLYGMEGSEKDEDKRRYWLDKVITLNANAGDKQTERSKYLAAGASYELAEFSRLKYESLPLTLPLNKSIPIKNKAMQEAQELYTQSVEMGVLEFTTSSTYRIGQLYTQLSKALLDSERPKGLDELELEEYQFLLEDQAYPFEQAAMDVQMKNINRTYDGIYDEWIKKSFDVMADLAPTQYRKDEKALSYVSEIR
ncbi:tetratricopeptide repeat protein [Oceanobacter antarcticus]|uniref:Tetratricopeptide repeat protein n=1 Tax=Oceanobacter antarcticus TaxID=3133425 RepID=A0ABW8NLY6_9GAMM